MQISAIVIKDQMQVTGCPQNFQVMEEHYDLGAPVGYGSTLKEAIDDFISIWELKNDESIDSLVIIEKA